jgi:fibronectin type 3 domain-containing protein
MRKSTVAFLALFFFWLLRPGFVNAQGTLHFNGLSWTASTSAGITGQKVYRSSIPGGPYNVIATLNATATSYQDTAVALGSNHCYVLTAISGANESVFGNEICVVDAGTNVNPHTALAVTSH